MYNKFLVLGLESSATRMVSKFLASLVGIIKSVDEWNGRWEISNNEYEIIHRSLPHGDRDNYVNPEDFGSPDELYIVLCIRDQNVAYESALNLHNKGDSGQGAETQRRAREKMVEIIESGKWDFCFFDYESAAYLGKSYLNWWAKSHLELENNSDLEVYNGNKKYFSS